MSRLAWLEEAGGRYLNRVREENVEFLVELDISTEETAALLDNLAHSPYLPSAAWANACVAVAAVVIARDASEQDRAFVPLFMRSMKLQPNQNIWQDRFGWRIEQIIYKFFPDDYRAKGGAFRYVGPVYRHVGVPAPALPRFARFIKQLLDTHGPYLTRENFVDAKHDFRGLAAKFLASEHGYRFVSNSVRVLRKLEVGEIQERDVEKISGYRRGFWTEVLQQLRHLPKAEQRSPGNPCGFPEPILALVPEQGRLILRFDMAGVGANAYRLNRSLVCSGEVRVTSGKAPTLQINDRLIPIGRWWSPEESKAALFRESDGGFVAAEGGVPPGSYWLALTSSLQPPVDWQPEEGLYLDRTDFQIWHVNMPAGSAFDSVDIHSTNTRVMPELRFSFGIPHSLGRTVFEDRLPPITLSGWDHQNADRFEMFLDDERGRQKLILAPGTTTIILDTKCPSQGLLRIEPTGFMRQTSALPVLPFTILPSGISVRFSDSGFGPSESALLATKTPADWKVDFALPQTTPGVFEFPSDVQILEGTLTNGRWSKTFSIRVPRYSISLSSEGRLLWKGPRYQDERVHIEGSAQHKVKLQLLGTVGRNLTDWLTIPSSGMLSIPFSDFLDALEHPEPTAMEFALATFSGKTIRSAWFYAVEARIIECLEIGKVDENIFRLPEIGQLVADADAILKGGSRECPGDMHSIPPAIRKRLATLFCCAASFDGRLTKAPLADWADQDVVQICHWYERAVAWQEPGAKAAELAASAPLRMECLPVKSWQDQVLLQIERLRTLASLADLVTKWREAIRLRDGSDVETQIGRRKMGTFLSEGATKYYLAMQRHSENAKQRDLVAAIGALKRARTETDCEFVQALADLLLALAYTKYGREDLITEKLEDSVARLGVNPRDASPWEGDYGND